MSFFCLFIIIFMSGLWFIIGYRFGLLDGRKEGYRRGVKNG